MKKLFKYGSNVLLVIILVILLVPSWRIAFQGWFQGLFMQELTLSQTHSTPPTPALDNWQLTATDNTSLTYKQFYGQPVILSFWATWCPPCRAELKELRELKKTWGNKIHFVSVTEESLPVIGDSGLDDDYDFLYSTKRFPSFFNVNAYPTLCILDKKGVLVFKHSGAGRLSGEKNSRFLNGLIENG